MSGRFVPMASRTTGTPRHHFADLRLGHGTYRASQSSLSGNYPVYSMVVPLKVVLPLGQTPSA